MQTNKKEIVTVIKRFAGLILLYTLFLFIFSCKLPVQKRCNECCDGLTKRRGWRKKSKVGATIWCFMAKRSLKKVIVMGESLFIVSKQIDL